MENKPSLKKKLRTRINESSSVRLVCASLFSVCGSLVSLLVLIVAFGAIIQALEEENEIEKNQQFFDLLDRLRSGAANDDDINLVAEFAGRDVTRGFEGFTTFESERRWSAADARAFFGATAYAFDLASTVGYGNVRTETTGGRAVSILAIVVLFPIAVVAYTRLSEFIYNQLGNRLISNNRAYRAVIDRYDKEGIGELDVKELYLILQDLGLQVTNEQSNQILRQYDFSENDHLDVAEFRQLCVDLNIKIGLLARENFKVEVSLIVFLLYVLLFTVISYLAFLDNFFDSFYFVVVTVTTVGIGDIVPPQELRAPFAVLSFIGIGFMALLFKAVIDKLYAKTDLKKRYFHRALEPVFNKGKIVSVRLKDKLVPEEDDEAVSVGLEDEKGV